ncbi:lipopolysaccharide transport system permease protein [Hyunsoonleella jejuensis]|uniref:Transport permease protein n=1 Tax=Hyunsoonleella jejuensis TaxID=419940 RepID=A0A1H9D6S6_9FLAO|nr:ABC transporter permease [Hyunsoonleella jejuensis]SEQ09160.1 lipopolysaccharide transport system permease protein [Hyunsoonleella jejuensis]
MKNENSNSEWLYTISPKGKFIDFNFKEIWRYKDLLFLFVKRDVITLYKQTVLGPLWYLIQPLITSVIFTIIFNGIANINVGANVHPFLFNLAGVTIWNYFAECLKGTSDSFKKNQNIFSKVYFPRVIMPMTVVISSLLKFGIQFLIFIGFYLFFAFQNKAGTIDFNALILLPLLVLLMGLLGLGLGMIISSMTTKYRDLSFLVGFGVQLLMYVSAVMYPIQDAVEKIESNFPQSSSYINPIIENNPLAYIVETFRYMFFSQGEFSTKSILITLIVSVCIALLGLVIFNKTEKSFIDTV